MTQEDIIRMAREAGFFVKDSEAYSPSVQYDHELTPYIERFAALVAAAEREACAKVVDAIEAQCVADDVDDPPLAHIAATIRARGQEIDPNQWAFDNGLEST